MNQPILESTFDGGKVVYRIRLGNVVSPNLRSKDAAQMFLQSGAFVDYVAGLSAITKQAAQDAKFLDARSDAELEEMLKPKEPPTLLTTSQ